MSKIICCKCKCIIGFSGLPKGLIKERQRILPIYCAKCGLEKDEVEKLE